MELKSYQIYMLLCVLLIGKSTGAPDPEYLRDYIDIAKKFLDYANIILECENYDQAVQMFEMLERTCEEGQAVLDDFNEQDFENDAERLTHARLAVLVGKLLLMKLNIQQFVNHDAHQPQTLPVIRDGRPGRPRREITREQIEFLRQSRFKWTSISRILGVSERTLRRRRAEFGMVDNFFIPLTNEELDQRVRNIKKELPLSCGIGSIQGHLQRQGIFIANARKRIWQSLRRIQPEETALRMTSRIDRRVYWTPGARYMYHMDGNHKMRRYSIVIHGAVDGASRLIVFMKASDNNFAQTVKALFIEGVIRHGWCENLRTDRGGENVLAGRLVETNGGRHLQGSSTHNIRIERLWRDTRIYCFSFFLGLFSEMETRQLLNADDNLDITALQSIFIPRVNRSLENFVAAHNMKPHRSLGNQTPHQKFLLSHFTYSPNVPDNLPNAERYEPFSFRLLDITQQEKDELKALITHRVPNPCISVPDHGVRMYRRARRIIRNFMRNR